MPRQHLTNSHDGKILIADDRAMQKPQTILAEIGVRIDVTTVLLEEPPTSEYIWDTYTHSMVEHAHH